MTAAGQGPNVGECGVGIAVRALLSHCVTRHRWHSCPILLVCCANRTTHPPTSPRPNARFQVPHRVGLGFGVVVDQLWLRLCVRLGVRLFELELKALPATNAPEGQPERQTAKAAAKGGTFLLRNWPPLLLGWRLHPTRGGSIDSKITQRICTRRLTITHLPLCEEGCCVVVSLSLHCVLLRAFKGKEGRRATIAVFAAGKSEMTFS